MKENDIINNLDTRVSKVPTITFFETTVILEKEFNRFINHDIYPLAQQLVNKTFAYKELLNDKLKLQEQFDNLEERSKLYEDAFKEMKKTMEFYEVLIVKLNDQLKH